VTPINDSFLDFDVLGTVDPETYSVTGESHYAEMVTRRPAQAPPGLRPKASFAPLLSTTTAKGSYPGYASVVQIGARSAFVGCPYGSAGEVSSSGTSVTRSLRPADCVSTDASAQACAALAPGSLFS
jgi:ATPase MipZ